MISLTANILKSSVFSPFIGSNKTDGSIFNPITRPVNPRPVSATLIPSSDRQAPPKQQLYQPFRPPPSPVPSKFRSLDTAGKIEVLSSRMGLWFEYAPLISSLYTEGLTPPMIEELTGISGVEQNRLIVAAQVHESLVHSGADPEIIAAFETGGAELLYEIRLLSATQRAAAAAYIVNNGFDAKRSQDLARSIKDYPRRKGDLGWKEFNYGLPGDCLSFMYYRQSREHKNPSEQRTTMLEQALEAVESERAKNAVVRELDGLDNEGRGKGRTSEYDRVRVPVVRLQFGEVAEASKVVVLPVCNAEEGGEKVQEAPAELKPEGEFGVVEAEKGWSRWVVLPGWWPVVTVEKGVVVAFGNDQKVLPWRGKEEGILVVVNREITAVEADDGFYLVTGSGGGGGGEVKMERGAALKGRGVVESLGQVVMVVRPPREEEDDQLNDEDWE